MLDKLSSMALKPTAKKTTAKTNTKPVAAKKIAAGKAVLEKAKPAAKPPTKRPAPIKKASAASKRTVPIKSQSHESHVLRPLSDQEQEFVNQLLIDFNGKQAAIRAKYSPRTATQQASRLLTKANVIAALADARKRQQERTEITADRVLREAWLITTADARELVDLHVGCCRHCYGEGHKYQRTQGEMDADRQQWIDKGKSLGEFDEQGGIGFDARKPPKEECPECAGTGYSRVVLKDTRYLSPQALALYAGAKEGKYGIEIQMHDKSTFAEKLFKHLGLYEKDNEQKADALASLLHRVAQTGGNSFTPIAEDPEAPPARAPMGSVQPNVSEEEDE